MLSSRPPILPIRPQPVNPRDLSEYAAIPIPDGSNNTEVLRAVKQVIDTLMRERGNFKASLITIQDLEDLGLINVSNETDRVEISFVLKTGPSSNPLSQYMLWRGLWETGMYSPHETVRDGRWTMVAVTETQERPAPGFIGDPFFIYQGTGLTPIAQNAQQIIFGTRFTALADEILVSIRVDVVAGDTYRIFSVTDPLGDAVIIEEGQFIASTTGWVAVEVSPRLLPIGTVFDIGALVQRDAAAPVTFVGDWDYRTPGSNSTPIAGNVIHSSSRSDLMNVHYIDKALVDRSAELQALQLGDTISARSLTWTIQGSVNQGSYITFTVVPTTRTSPQGVTEFTFETIPAALIETGRDVGYWLTSPHDAKGLFGVDIPYEDIVPDDTAYGIDIEVQRATISLDWELVAINTFGAAATALPPIAQMVSTAVTELLAPGDIVAPFEIQWARDAIPDKTAGTILISADGVYSVSFDISGTAAASNSEQIFTIRADGVTIAIIESVQKQSQEGVQAALVIRARLLAGQIVDVRMTGDSNMTAEHMVLSLAYHSSLLNIVES